MKSQAFPRFASSAGRGIFNLIQSYEAPCGPAYSTAHIQGSDGHTYTCNRRSISDARAEESR